MLRIYKASAGSGKTFTLTKQYLQLLLGWKNPETGKWQLRTHPNGANRAILAITFTNKATDEMTRRIIKELAILAGREAGHDKKSAYLNDFMTLFNASGESITKIASETLDDLLADFTFFNVSTIDAFFQNVLRVFAREIEMPDNFELELDSRYAISLGVNEMFKSINASNPLDPVKKRESRWVRQWLTRFMERMFDNGKALNIFSRNSSLYLDLVSTFNRLIDEDFKINSSRITDYLCDINRLIAFEKGIDNSLNDALESLQIQSRLLISYGDYPNVNHHLRNCIEQWALGNMRKPSDTVIAAIDTPSKRYAAAYFRKGEYSADFDNLIRDICILSREIEAIKARNEAIMKSVNAFGLLGFLLRYITDYCKENNLILLSETNSLLRDIINDDDTPFVYERLGYYLRHFLIDEFQDTSRLQWQNLKPLVMESLSHSNDDLVIGDEKQCIYRFRNSDPDLLGHEIAREVEDVYGNGAVSIEGDNIAENNNWRSSKEVVCFNNSIFHTIASAIGDSETYSNVIQQISPKRDKNIAGYTKLIFEPEADLEPDPSPQHPQDADNDLEEEDNDESFALTNTLAEIDRMLSSGYAPGDIAVLVRTHREGELVINAIINASRKDTWRHGPVKVSSADSIGVAASSAVKMIIQILRLTQMPQVVNSKRKRRDGTIEDVAEINPAYRRTRLLYCFEYYRHLPVTDPDGTKRNPTSWEALSAAIRAISDDPVVKEAEQQALMGKSPEIFSLLNFRKPDKPAPENSHDDPANEGHDGNNTGSDKPTYELSTLTSLVDSIIQRFILPETLAAESAFITAFQDLVYDFSCRGNSDIRAFLDWWDRSGNRSGLSSIPDDDAINVMTIHQSKGLEFPCVIIPFANWELIKYSTSRNPSNRWMPLSPDDFPGIPAELIPPMLPMEFTRKLLDIDIFKDYAAEVVRQMRIDALNVAYVAFTRAVNELIVVVPASKKEENLGNYLLDAIYKLTPQNISDDTLLDNESKKWILPLHDLWIEGNIVAVGSPTHKNARSGDTPAPQQPPTLMLPQYNPSVNSKLTNLTSSDIEAFDFDLPRHRGDFLHRVLSRVRHRRDLDRELRKAAYRAHLTAEQTLYCRQILEDALAMPEAEKWFEGYYRVICEQTISNNDKRINFGLDSRPDRIVWTSDGHIDVVDYKFGEEKKEYRKQLLDYARLLKRAGYTNIRMFLWYIPDKKIVELSNHYK